MPYDDTNYGVDVNRWLNNGVNNKIVVKSVNPESKDKSPFTVLLASDTDKYESSDAEKVEISATTGASSSIKILSKSADDLDSTEKLTFAIYDADSTNNILAGSEKTITFTETAQSEYKSYEVNDLGTMYNDGKDAVFNGDSDKYKKYDKKVEVFGITADGTKVALPADMFVVTTDSKLKVENAVISDYADSATSNEFVSETDFKDNAGKSITKTVKVNVAIKDTATNSIATTITKDLVLSDVAPKVTTIGFNTTGDNKVENGKASVNGGYIAKATLDAYVKADDVKDQYGVKKSEGLAQEELSYTISDVKKVDGSGFYVDESNAIYDAKLGDTFKVTYVQGDAKETVDFTVGAGIEYDSSASSAITSAVSSLDTALVKESQSNASSDKYEFDLSSTLSSVNSDIKVVAGTADLIEINKAKPSITVKQITQEDNSRDVTFTVTISKRGGQTVTKTYKLTIDANGTSYSITDVTPA